MRVVFGTLVGFMIVAVVGPTGAGVVVYEEGEKRIEIGGRIQLQYLSSDPAGGSSTDDLFFRRLRPYVQGTVTKDWLAKIEFDLGKANDSDEVAIKDAYVQYGGWKNHKITVGSAKTPFSRKNLTSSKRHQLVETNFAGDHNFGSPDRQLGLRLDGQALDRKITYAAALGSEEHDPAIGKLDFESPTNTQSDWNQGVVVAARIDYHPRGLMKFDQGDFRSDDWKYSFSAAAFNWSNDDDNNTFTDSTTGMVNAAGLTAGKVDLDRANGIELSAGIRGNGLSADVENQMIDADTVDPAFTGGLYLNGTADLHIMAVEAGYMFHKKVEVVAGWDSMDTDNFTDGVRRTSVGLNWFLNQHKTKLQTTFRSWENVGGVTGVDLDELFAQFQFVF